VSKANTLGQDVTGFSGVEHALILRSSHDSLSLSK